MASVKPGFIRFHVRHYIVTNNGQLFLSAGLNYFTVIQKFNLPYKNLSNNNNFSSGRNQPALLNNS